ncbi:hypothetical protein [Sulfurimonas sp. HSL-1716]|uniref:hypothetical protein n=1 Tax=Hydrocurvibacter sulfurireducens TaxID=3131937 RepID=UPI0031F78D31
MKKLQIKLLTGRSGPDGSHAPGDKITVSIKEAINLINSNQAEPVNIPAYEDAVFKLDEQIKVDREREAKANAIRYKEMLELELKDLYRQVALKTAEIEGVVLTDEEIESFVDVSLEGEKFKEKEL